MDNGIGPCPLYIWSKLRARISLVKPRTKPVAISPTGNLSTTVQNTSKTAISEDSKSIITITHVTTTTAIVDIDGAKFITDPIFDEAPQSHDRSHVAGLKPGEFFLTLQEGPAISIKQLPIIECVLLSHEDHIDNLDETGRQLLIGRRVITTPDGAKSLSHHPGTCAIEP